MKKLLYVKTGNVLLDFNVNGFDIVKEIFQYESRKFKLKCTIQIIRNIKTVIREDCEKRDAKK